MAQRAWTTTHSIILLFSKYISSNLSIFLYNMKFGISWFEPSVLLPM
jgi:hypothetical protein